MQPTNPVLASQDHMAENTFKEEYLMAGGSYMKFKFSFVHVKLTGSFTLVPSCTIYGWFFSTQAVLNSCDRDFTDHKVKICTVYPFTEGYRTADINQV